MMKMIFISLQKLFSFSKCLSFDFLIIYQNGLIKKKMLISGFITLQSG